MFADIMEMDSVLDLSEIAFLGRKRENKFTKMLRKERRLELIKRAHKK